MARIAGRSGVLYVAVTSGGAATPLTYIKKFALEASTERYDVTAFQDTSRVYTAGLPDSSGSFDGFHDDTLGFANFSAYQSAVDGIARKWYWYPKGGAAPYAAGTGFFDASFDEDVQGVVTIKGTFNAATPTFTSG